MPPLLPPPPALSDPPLLPLVPAGEGSFFGPTSLPVGAVMDGTGVLPGVCTGATPLPGPPTLGADVVVLVVPSALPTVLGADATGTEPTEPGIVGETAVTLGTALPGVVLTPVAPLSTSLSEQEMTTGSAMTADDNRLKHPMRQLQTSCKPFTRQARAATLHSGANCHDAPEPLPTEVALRTRHTE